MLSSDGNLKISDFGLSALASDMSGELLHTTCLAYGTKVARADAKTHAERFIAVEEITAGMRLVGTGDPVAVVQTPTVHTTDEMYEIHLRDGFSYRVTPDHLVTLKWIAGPYTDVKQISSSTQEKRSSSISLSWWIWRDNTLSQGHIERRCRLTSEPEPQGHSAAIHSEEPNQEQALQ